MCGFSGFFGKNTHNKIDALQASLKAIRHRGPDSEAIWVSPDYKYVCAHARLSVIDLSETANQPFSDKMTALVFNGEIYNHLSLRADYLRDTKFLSTSDTETVFYLLKLYGPTFLKKLQGMFSLAFYDLCECELYLARDTLSTKPLYYHADSTGISFSSEIRGLMELIDDVKVSFDEKTLARYLEYENWEEGASLFCGINVVPPGKILRFNLNNGFLHGITFTFHYEAQKPSFLPAQGSLPHSPGLPRYLIDCITKSVNEHLLSDVPLATYLSGGIDSGLVTCLAARQTDNLLAFTGYFKGNSWYDERKLAREIAKRADVKLFEVEITEKHFYESFDEIILTLEEPRMGMGTFSQYVVAREVAKYRKVVLSGAGGDELFAGYPIFKTMLFLEDIFSPKAWVNLATFSRKEWPWIFYEIFSKFFAGKYRFAPSINKQKFSYGEYISDQPLFMTAAKKNLVTKLIEYYRKVYIPGLMSVEDRISMHFGLETRFPLWSQQLLFEVSQLHARDILYMGKLKGLLKHAILEYDILPKEIVHGPKKGFPTPLRHWFRAGLYDFINERLLGSDSNLHSLFKKSYIKNLLVSHYRFELPGPFDEGRAHKIWILLCIESVMRQFKIVG